MRHHTALLGPTPFQRTYATINDETVEGTKRSLDGLKSRQEAARMPSLRHSSGCDTQPPRLAPPSKTPAAGARRHFSCPKPTTWRPSPQRCHSGGVQPVPDAAQSPGGSALLAKRNDAQIDEMPNTTGCIHTGRCRSVAQPCRRVAFPAAFQGGAPEHRRRV